MTFLRAMSAVDRTPQRRLVIGRSVSRSGCLTRTGVVDQCVTTFGRKEHKSGDDAAGSGRAAQRDGPPGESERDRARAARRRSRVALGARRPDRPDPQRDPRPDRRAVRGGPRVRGARRAAGRPGRPSPVVRPNPHGAVVLALEIAVDSIAAAVVGLGGEVFERIRVDRPQRPLVGRGDRRRPRRAGGRPALAATAPTTAGRRRGGGRRRRPAERRVRLDGAQPRLA